MLNVKCATPNEILFEGQASHMIVPGELGTLEICPLHKALVTRLLAGIMVVDGKVFQIQHGAVKVNQNDVTAIVELKK
jgi:F0F1-type ATP synthase epsilon subunit